MQLFFPQPLPEDTALHGAIHISVRARQPIICHGLHKNKTC